MENLLFQILQSPVDSTINSLETRLDSQEGVNEFLFLLKSNNLIAFTYMKMKIKDWASNPRRRELLNNKEAFYSLIDSCTPQNLELYCDTLESMSLCGVVWDDLVEYLAFKDFHRSLRVLNALFKKFRILKRSNELYSEIISSILKTSPLFTKYYLETQAPSTDVNLLEMFYSLVYQDIHPFFEDNSPKFFSSFVALYKQKDLQDTLSEIYNLYILKYPECVDMTQVLGSVLTGISTYDYRKYQILLNISRRKNIHAVSKFKDIFIYAIQLGGMLSEKEKEEMDDNTLEYTRTILKQQDNYRGMVSEIVTHCKMMFGGEWVSKLISSTTSKEMVIFFYLSFKIREEGVLGECRRIVGEDPLSDPYLTVVSLRYLLLMEDYTLIGRKALSSTHPGRYFSFHLLRKFFDRQFGVKDFFLRALDLVINPPLIDVNPSLFLDSTLNFIVNNREDEFSTGLLLSLMKYGQDSDALCLSPQQLNLLYVYIKENILNINSISSFNNLFDVLGLVYLKTKEDSFILELLDTVLQEDLVDLYSSTFYLLSLVVLVSHKDLSGLLQIITIEKLWNTKELRLSLVCLTSSLFKKGYCSKEQLDYILSYLPKPYSYILLGNTLPTFVLPKEEDLEEIFILKTLLAKSNSISKEEYRLFYQESVFYFMNNFITKKNTRRVLRALGTGSRVLNIKGCLKEVIGKNSVSLDYGSVPLSVIVVFDI